MNPANTLMCVNIPRGITEDDLCEIFCVAGPIEDITIGRSGKSCFIVYEFGEAVKTAKEIFKDINIYGRSIELYDQEDIKEMHKDQEEEIKSWQKREPEYADTPKHYRFDTESPYGRSNPYHNVESMTPQSRNNFSNFRGRPNHSNYPLPDYQASGNNQHNIPSYNPPEQQLKNDRMNPSFPPELDVFKSPYSHSVSRNNYEQFKRGHYGGGDAPNVNQQNYQSTRYDHRNKHSGEFVHNSPSNNSYSNSNDNSYGSKKQKSNDFYNQISDDVYPVNETNVEQNYEDHVRRQFHNSSRNPPRDDNRRHQSKFKNSPSTSSDYVVRNKSREFDRSPYSRHDYKRQDRGARRPNDHYNKDSRNRRR